MGQWGYAPAQDRDDEDGGHKMCLLEASGGAVFHKEKPKQLSNSCLKIIQG